MVVFVIGLISIIVVPQSINATRRARTEGAVRAAVALLNGARLEAIRYQSQSVVLLDVDNGEIFAFLDIDGVSEGDAPDGVFNPVDGVGFRRTDYEIGRVGLPDTLAFRSPTDDGTDSIDGFVNLGTPDPPDLQAMFLPDGSAVSTGAFRIADSADNFLEVRVSPQVTGRVFVRKWFSDAWHERREGDEVWPWY